MEMFKSFKCSSFWPYAAPPGKEHIELCVHLYRCVYICMCVYVYIYILTLVCVYAENPMLWTSCVLQVRWQLGGCHEACGLQSHLPAARMGKGLCKRGDVAGRRQTWRAGQRLLVYLGKNGVRVLGELSELTREPAAPRFPALFIQAVPTILLRVKKTRVSAHPIHPVSGAPSQEPAPNLLPVS